MSVSAEYLLSKADESEKALSGYKRYMYEDKYYIEQQDYAQEINDIFICWQNSIEGIREFVSTHTFDENLIIDRLPLTTTLMIIDNEVIDSELLVSWAELHSDGYVASHAPRRTAYHLEALIMNAVMKYGTDDYIRACRVKGSVIYLHMVKSPYYNDITWRRGLQEDTRKLPKDL